MASTAWSHLHLGAPPTAGRRCFFPWIAAGDEQLRHGTAAWHCTAPTAQHPVPIPFTLGALLVRGHSGRGLDHCPEPPSPRRPTPPPLGSAPEFNYLAFQTSLERVDEQRPATAHPSFDAPRLQSRRSVNLSPSLFLNLPPPTRISNPPLIAQRALRLIRLAGRPEPTWFRDAGKPLTGSIPWHRRPPGLSDALRAAVPSPRRSPAGDSWSLPLVHSAPRRRSIPSILPFPLSFRLSRD